MGNCDCDRKQIKCPDYFFRWVDITKHLASVSSQSVKCTLVEKVIRAGLRWHGTPHRGVDDALG